MNVYGYSDLEHTDQARATARDTGCDIGAYAVERGWSGVGLGPVGQTRDSGALERSNFECACAAMRELNPDAFDIARFNHWACGWIDEITHDTGNPAMVELVASLRAALANYPALNDEHFSGLEYDEMLQALEDIWRVPADRAGDVFSALFDGGVDCAPDDLRDDDVRAAIAECGMDPDDPSEPLPMPDDLSDTRYH